MAKKKAKNGEMSFDKIIEWEHAHPGQLPPKEMMDWLKDNSSMYDGGWGSSPWICDDCLNKMDEGTGCDAFEDVNDVNQSKRSGKCKWYLKRLSKE